MREFLATVDRREVVLTEEDWREFGVVGQDEDAWYVLDFDEAREAAEYHAIRQDLAFVTETCDVLENRLLRQEAKEQQVSWSASAEEYLDRSLWIAALTTYGRCFLLISAQTSKLQSPALLCNRG